MPRAAQAHLDLGRRSWVGFYILIRGENTEWVGWGRILGATTDGPSAERLGHLLRGRQDPVRKLARLEPGFALIPWPSPSPAPWQPHSPSPSPKG